MCYPVRILILFWDTLVCVCVLYRFIAAYNDIKTRSPDLSDDQLFSSASDKLRSSGFTLRPVSDIQKVSCDELSMTR